MYSWLDQGALQIGLRPGDMRCADSGRRQVLPVDGDEGGTENCSISPSLIMLLASVAV